jgi:hypothetical protein
MHKLFCNWWVKMANIEVPQEIIDKLARFMEFHFEARYPEEQNKF